MGENSLLIFSQTQTYVKVYNLTKQELTTKLISGVKWISSLDIHPQGQSVNAFVCHRVQISICPLQVIISLLAVMTSDFAGSTWTYPPNLTELSGGVTHTHTHTHTRTHTHTHTRTHTHARTHTHTHAHTHTHTQTHMHTHTYTHTHAHTHAHTFIHARMHIQTSAQASQAGHSTGVLPSTIPLVRIVQRRRNNHRLSRNGLQVRLLYLLPSFVLTLYTPIQRR